MILELCPCHPLVNDNVLYHVRRAKARFSSGCKSRPAAFVPAGSNRSSCGGNETAEASGVEGHESDLASTGRNVSERLAGLERRDVEADPWIRSQAGRRPLAGRYQLLKTPPIPPHRR